MQCIASREYTGMKKSLWEKDGSCYLCCNQGSLNLDTGTHLQGPRIHVFNKLYYTCHKHLLVVPH